MAFELYSTLAGNVSPLTGENVKPAYGGEKEAFLNKVVTPIYDVIAKVFPFILIFYLNNFSHKNEVKSNLLSPIAGSRDRKR